MIYFLYAIFGLLPSIIWLLFYLRKDKHPEPNSMVIKVFTLGMLTGPAAVIAELSVRWLMNPIAIDDFVASLTLRNGAFFWGIVAVAPVVEEFLKFLVIKFLVLKNSAFDEPLDAMLYMVISGLGFAAVENLLLVFQKPMIGFGEVISLVALRFISATFVHALASGMIGYWLARSIKEPAKKYQLLATGFGLAIFFHASYNYLVWLSGKNLGLAAIAPISMAFIIIGLMAVAVSYNFSVLKKLHSLCRVCAPQTDLPQAK